jgi:hypothetical protein
VCSTPGGASSGARPIIDIQENYETLHTVLYFLYSKEMFLRNADDMKPTIGNDTPNHLTPEELYAAADRLRITAILDNIKIFWRESWNVKEMVQQTFCDEFTFVHTDVWDFYKEIYRQHWSWLVGNGEFQNAMDEVVGREDENRGRNFRRFWELIKAVGSGADSTIPFVHRGRDPTLQPPDSDDEE